MKRAKKSAKFLLFYYLFLQKSRNFAGLKHSNMIVVSSKDFATNQNKYFDMAMNERVFVQRGNSMFHLACSNEDTLVNERVYYEPDEDFYKSITKDELLKGIHEDIDNFFANK